MYTTDNFEQFEMFPLATDKETTPIERNNTVRKGKYDIHYVINLLRSIEDQCHKYRLNPSTLQFSLQNSLQRMIAMLEVERDQT